MRKMILAAATMATLATARETGAETADQGPIRVRYIVTDVQAAVGFYTKELGFRVLMQSGPVFAILSRGNLQLLLSPTHGPGGASQPMPNGDRPVPGGWNRLVIYTKDVKGDYERLKLDGAHLRSEPIAGPGGTEVLVDDPSGNPVELFQPG